jgi:predicted negative regulator of RcsB-dependent stress response
MKTRERHQLKQNEFVSAVLAAREWMAANRDRVVLGGIVVVGIIAVAGGYQWWRGRTADQAGALFGAAMATYESPVVPTSSVPGATTTPGSFTTEKARAEAALQEFQQVVQAYPKTAAGQAALYQSAEVLMSLDRFADAERTYQQVIDQSGGSLYGSLAKMGLAEAMLGAGQKDQAIKAYEALAAERDGQLPVDGVLMQLAKAYLSAGKTQEARTAFKRVADEFPDSVYVADARKQLAMLG